MTAEDVINQTLPVIRAIDQLVPTRYEGMHSNLTYLYDIAQDWKNCFLDEDRSFGPED